MNNHDEFVRVADAAPEMEVHSVHLYVAFWPGHKTLNARRAWEMAERVLRTLDQPPTRYLIRDGDLGWTNAPCDLDLVWFVSDACTWEKLLKSVSAAAEAAWPRGSTYCVGGCPSGTGDDPMFYGRLPSSPDDGWVIAPSELTDIDVAA